MRTHRYLTAGAVALAIAFSGMLAYGQSARPAKKATIEQRLQHMEDLEQIRDLLVAYGIAFDKRDYGGYGNLFAKDGVWVGGAQGAQSYTGPAAITAFVEKVYQPTVFPGSYHIMSSFDVDITGPDTATAKSRWTFVVHGVHNEPQIFRGGYYDDQLVREDGSWKFKRRVVGTDPSTAAK
jgi:uncharacterized protein (TIGR02246 family)